MITEEKHQVIIKSDIEEIRAGWVTYKGHGFYDVRTYVKDDSGQYKPTPKGITLSAEMLPKMIAALQTLQQEQDGEQ